MDVDLERVFADLADARGIPRVLTVADVRCGHTLAEAEARIRWRLAWYDGLATTGWSPPACVRAQIERDRALLEVRAADRLVERLPVDDGQREPLNGTPREPVDSRLQPVTALVARARDSARPSPAQGSRSSRVDSASCQCPVADNLREALASRAVIEQAKGMIMFAERCDPSTAFRALVAASQRSRRKLRDVAADLVASVATANAARARVR